jgi:endonuclease/exonuclease/phosphatase family metal-dependent hydrolase
MNAGRDQAFGNVVLIRLPVLQVFPHPLPQPADLASKNMPRQAMEIIAAMPGGPLRIVTTHLEFFSALQRAGQIKRLRELYAEASAASPLRSLAEGKGVFAPLPRPASSILCGDFNCEVQSEHYQCLTAPFANAIPALCDAWDLVNPGKPHAPTCGVFDKEQWPQGPHCRDFFLVSQDRASRVVAIEVNEKTNASDHQPVRMVLTDR